MLKLSPKAYASKAWIWRIGPALTIMSGYYGELFVTGDLTPRWRPVIVDVSENCPGDALFRNESKDARGPYLYIV